MREEMIWLDDDLEQALYHIHHICSRLARWAEESEGTNTQAEKASWLAERARSSLRDVAGIYSTEILAARREAE